MKKKNAGIIFGWALATVASILIATQAVASVRDRVTDRPSPVATVAQALASSTTAGDVATSTTDAATPATTAPETTTTGADPVTTTAGATTTDAPSTTVTVVTTTTEAPDTTLPPTTSTTKPVTTTTQPPSTTTSTTSTTSTTVAPNWQTATYELVGGWVRIRYDEANQVVMLDGAGPRPGFDVEVERTGPDEVDVEFESNTHKSKFKATFEGGELKIDIKEEDND